MEAHPFAHTFPTVFLLKLLYFNQTRDGFFLPHLRFQVVLFRLVLYAYFLHLWTGCRRSFGVATRFLCVLKSICYGLLVEFLSIIAIWL